MNDFFIKIVLAARNEDIDSWINILFVVMLAVFWAIGGIIKSKAKKSRQIEGKESNRGVPRPSGYPRSLQKDTKDSYTKARKVRATKPAQQGPYYPQVKQPRREVSRARHYKQKALAKKKSIWFAAKELAKELKPTSPIPEIQTDLKEIKEFAEPSLNKIETQVADKASKEPQIELIVEPLFDFSDPEELQKAILHYEILGKPISMRSPGEYIIGL